MTGRLVLCLENLSVATKHLLLPLTLSSVKCAACICSGRTFGGRAILDLAEEMARWIRIRLMDLSGGLNCQATTHTGADGLSRERRPGHVTKCEQCISPRSVSP
jgi:hypothetical protein